MKKLFSVILSLILSLSLSITCFASTVTTTNNSNTGLKPTINNISKVGLKPMISTWHYQNDAPMVGQSSNYNVFEGSVDKNLRFSQNITKLGLVALNGAIVTLLPATALAGAISSGIFYEIINNPVLDTPTLYVTESDYGLIGSSQLNYEVTQNWYADANHTKYVSGNVYYVSFY